MISNIYSQCYYKISQVLNTNLDSSDNVTDADKTAFQTHIKSIEDNSKIVSEWVGSNLGANNNNIRLLELNRFVEGMYNAAKILNTATDAYIKDNTQNKTITSIEQKLQPVVQNYNAARPNYISEDWMQQYSSTDEAKAINQIKDSIEFVKRFIEKQKRAESNASTDTPLPKL